VKYHKKSNKGRFSKKQKKASRHMMAIRSGYINPLNAGYSVKSDLKQAGIMASLLPILTSLGRSSK
jgi:hypothetical protein